MKTILGILLVVLCTISAHATTYYIDGTNGVDTNSGTIDDPFKTCNPAKAAINPGDIIIYRRGTYTCNWRDAIPSGTGISGRTVITAMPINRTCTGYAHTRATMPQCYDSTYEPVTFTRGILLWGNYDWIMFEGFTIDGNHNTDTGIQTYPLGSYATNGPACDNGTISLATTPNDIVLLNMKITRVNDSCVMSNPVEERIDLFNSTFDNCGSTTSDAHHGAYWGASESFIDRCTFSNNSNIGFQLHHGQRTTGCIPISKNTVVQNTRSFGNKAGAFLTGVTTGSTIKNNLFYNNLNNGLVVNSYHLGSPHKVYNNTIQNNGPGGLTIHAPVAIAKNNIVDGLILGEFSGGGTFENNYNACKTDGCLPIPDFIDAANGDFRIADGDTTGVINGGQDLTSVGVTTDFDGNSRPAGGAFDIGAFEQDSSGPPPQTFNFSVSDSVIEDEEPTITQGNSAVVTITVTKLAGTAVPVVFGTSTLPAGMTVTFNPASCTPSVTTCTTAMTIGTANHTPEGKYTISARGVAAGLTRTTSFPVEVFCQAVVEPGLETVVSIMNNVATYARAQYSASQTPVWNQGVLHAGLMAHYHVTENATSLTHTETFGSFNSWVLSTSQNQHNRLMAGSAWIDAYHANPVLERIADVRTQIQAQVAASFPGAFSASYNTADAIFMGPPTFIRLAEIDADQDYRDRAFLLWNLMHTTLALYDATDKLYYRDVSFIGALSPNSLKIFWSRGNGLAYYGLARILDELPVADPNRATYLTVFTDMSAAIASRQRVDGFWNSNLADPNHFGGPETSGTALFTAGLAWGVRTGILNSATYSPIVTKAWQGLTTLAIQGNGLVGYVQGIGTQPAATTSTSTADFGSGVVLLAGKEYYRFLGGVLP